MMHAYLITYVLAPWSRVIARLTGLQLVKKFPAFYGTRSIITAITNAGHLSLSRANSIQSISPHSTSCRSILILSSHIRQGLPNGLFPSGFPTKTVYRTPLIWRPQAPDQGSTVGGLLSVSPPEEHHERRTFCRRGGNQRTRDSGSAIDS
jgi:hypothetical protein